MTLQELEDMLDEDIKIDGTKLQYEASNNPVLHAKWLRLYSNLKRDRIRTQNEIDKNMKLRLDHYSGRGDDVIMSTYERSEMKTVLSGDDIIRKLNASLTLYDIMVDFCSKALDIVKARGFAIKNMIDIRLMESGK